MVEVIFTRLTILEQSFSRINKYPPAEPPESSATHDVIPNDTIANAPEEPTADSHTGPTDQQLYRHIEVAFTRIRALEEKLKVEYWYKTDTKDNECMIEGCHHKYKQSKHLLRHIDERDDPSHQAANIILHETMCFQCRQSFQRPRDLVSHEKECHEAQYTSRMNDFNDIFNNSV